MENVPLQMIKAELELALKCDHKAMAEYKSWFISNAKLFTVVDEELSKKLARDIHAEIKQCYHNSFLGLNELENVKYYEGFVYSTNAPVSIDHSWLVSESTGKVIDPTLGMDPKDKLRQIQKRFGKKSKLGATLAFDKQVGDQYYGVEIPKHIVNEMAFKREASGDFIHNYWRLKSSVSKTSQVGEGGKRI